MEFLGDLARRILLAFDKTDPETCAVDNVEPLLSSVNPDTPSEWVFLGIIVALFVALVSLWVEYRRLKRRTTRPEDISGEAKEQFLQEALKEVAEFMVPMKNQRFRKRDRFYFHGKKLARKITANVQRVGSDPLMLSKNFIK